MAPKQRGEKRSKLSEDSLIQSLPQKRFVSNNAKVNFNTIKESRKPILERGFDFEREECVEVYENLCKRKWEKFCKSPSMANISLVREFYANAIERKDYKVCVRGKLVSFDPVAINEHYDILLTRFDSCYDVYERNPDLDFVSSVICEGDIEWSKTKGARRSFMSKCLSLPLTIWFLFITTRIMPGTHISEVTKERAILLHAIHKGYKLNVGQLLCKAILGCIDNARVGLYFPSLISDLCIKASVPTSNDDEWKKPMNPINSIAINRIYNNKYDRSEKLASSSTATQPRTTINVSMNARMAKLESSQSEMRNWATYQTSFNDYQCESMKSMDGILRGIATHLNIDMTQFPSTSACPPSFRFPGQDNEEDEEEEDDNDDEENEEDEEEEDDNDDEENEDDDEEGDDDDDGENNDGNEN